MDTKFYRVYFSKNHYIGLYADNRREAKILAKADRIENGKHYNITKVEDVENNSVYKVI